MLGHLASRLLNEKGAISNTTMMTITAATFALALLLPFAFRIRKR